MKFTPPSAFIPGLRTVGLIVLLTFTAIFLWAVRGESAEPGITIVSPLPGASFSSGQTVAVVVEPTPGFSIQQVFVIIAQEDPIEIDDSAPFEVFLNLPDSIGLGPKEIVAFATDQEDNFLETSIQIIIESSTPLASIKVRPDSFFFSSIGNSRYIDVTGNFQDDFKRDITKSPDTTFVSDNTAVAVVDTDGRVEAIGPGTTIINVNHKTFSRVIPITVAMFGLSGDLDGDADIDRDDLTIILGARNTPATGTDDPRDLDGDGLITALDARILVTMCTRPRCATE